MEKRLAEQCTWYQQNWGAPTRKGAEGASACIQGGCGFGGFKSGCQLPPAAPVAVGPLSRLAMARLDGTRRTDHAVMLRCPASQGRQPAGQRRWLAGSRGCSEGGRPSSLAGGAHGVEGGARLQVEEKQGNSVVRKEIRMKGRKKKALSRGARCWGVPILSDTFSGIFLSHQHTPGAFFNLTLNQPIWLALNVWFSWNS